MRWRVEPGGWQANKVAVAEAKRRAADNPNDASVRAEIGNAYFDGERYPEAITWDEEAEEAAARAAGRKPDDAGEAMTAH